ncbi:MAG: hypothetical protein E7461_03925 [Ruminococcaceae bacterium]|nr:hypothetical protein [Oscillospiraceae bacterium]
MKKRIALVLCLAMIAGMFAGCDISIDSILSMLPGFTAPTEPTNPLIPEPTVAPTEPAPTEPADPWADYECITIAEALTLCEQFVDAPSAERYYIRATIKSIDNATYGQMTIEDATGSIMVYGSANADGTVRYDAMTEKPDAGDEVLLYGTLQNYKGNTKEVQSGWIIDFVSKDLPAPELPAFDSTLTIAELLALPLADTQITEGRYFVRGTVQSVTNAQYGAMRITDGKDTISVYGSYSKDGATGYAAMTDKPVKGDEVLLYATVKNFKGTIELNSAWIQEFTTPVFDESAYTTMSVADARKAAEGTKVKVTGVVARITYANGMIPSGVILVDSTGSIYVYDGDLAARCAIGNTITLCASKTYWVLETEQTNANKFGYKGCNQLENAMLMSNDEGNTAFDKSWIQSTTVQSIMNTPVSQDITTLIYKVTAQVKRVDGNGFINYYINDLDGKTGSYTYTQCSGGDFAWLDEFDGKICTVYLTALNAKSSASGCVWRFLPVAVVDEGFDVSSVNFAENAVKFYGIPQFLTKYTGNPAMELLTSCDNELLGYNGIALRYTSSDPEIISVDGNVLNCLNSGTVKITVTATYNDVTYSEDVTIEVKMGQADVAYGTVDDAIKAELNEKVTVKGVVGPSLVNQDGFYLIDDTGIIAVLTDKATLETLEIGYEVVLEGNRYYKAKNGVLGNTCISDAKVVVNNYGSHEYSTASFDGTLTLAEFAALDVNTDYTTSVYTVTATIELVETSFYTNLKIVDGSTSINLYCSGAGQYKWLWDYDGQTITMEIAPCNWSSKSTYPGCVLAVINADGTKTVNSLNFG